MNDPVLGAVAVRADLLIALLDCTHPHEAHHLIQIGSAVVFAVCLDCGSTLEPLSETPLWARPKVVTQILLRQRGELPKPPTLVHVLLQGAPLCGMMPGHAPCDWPAGHSWMAMSEALLKGHRPDASFCPGCSDRLLTVATSLRMLP